MEGSVFGKDYMGLDYSDGTMKLLQQLKDCCKAFNGDFTLLWHNSYFSTQKDKDFYEKLIQ